MVSIIAGIIKDTVQSFTLWIHNHTKQIAEVIDMLYPYLIAYLVAGELRPNVGWFLPPLFWCIVYVLKMYAKRTGKGISVPKPVTRFTEVSEDGEITIPTTRIEELILYMCDLEDWFEKEKI